MTAGVRASNQPGPDVPNGAAAGPDWRERALSPATGTVALQTEHSGQVYGVALRDFCRGVYLDLQTRLTPPFLDEAAAAQQHSPVEKYVAAAVNDLMPGRGRVVTVGGVEIGLFLSAGGYRAYRNFCPHAGAPICRGEISRAPAAPLAPGTDRPEAGGVREILRCPWHAWEFDLETGENLAYPRCRLDAFAVEVIDGQLVVSI